MSKGLGHSEIYLDEEQLKNKIFKIDMGHPFLTISIKDLEDDLKIKNFRKILDKVLTRENENIVYRNLKLPFMRWLHNYDTNSEKIIFAWAHDERNPQLLLKSIGHIIISLCHNYKINNKLDDYQSLRKFVFRLPFNKDYKSSLITLGFRDKQGKEIK
jgi:hypothetical protein